MRKPEMPTSSKAHSDNGNNGPDGVLAEAVHDGLNIPLCRRDHQAQLLADALDEVALG